MSRNNEVIEFLTQDCIKNHPDLAGIVLLGSFSANQGDVLSDIDVDFIYYEKGYAPVKLLENNCEWDLQEHIFEDYPGISYEHWHCMAYVTAKILLDKTGEIQNKIDKLVRPGFEYFKEGLSDVLDNYYDAYFRSMKSLRRNNVIGAHIMACNSMNALNVILYRLNGSLQTYINRLPAVIYELETLPMPADKLLAHITNIAEKADADSQIQVYLSIRDMMNRLGYTKIYEAWEGKLDREIELSK